MEARDQFHAQANFTLGRELPIGQEDALASWPVRRGVLLYDEIST
jgi:hypothetical protein